MNKIILLVIFFLVFGFNKKPNNNLYYKNFNPITVDTLFFNYKDELKFNDFVVLHLIEKKQNKNKIITAKYTVNFYENNKIIHENIFEAIGFDEGSVFSCSYVLDSINSPYKIISLGYPACGYSANNTLYHINKKNSSKVYSWISTYDSGWFSDVSFYKISDAKISAITKSYWPADELLQEEIESNDEIGILEHSDSLVFTYNKGKWKKVYKTPKGKTYFSKRISFNTLHNFNSE